MCVKGVGCFKGRCFFGPLSASLIIENTPTRSRFRDMVMTVSLNLLRVVTVSKVTQGVKI
jgi:hypothetical protein